MRGGKCKLARVYYGAGAKGDAARVLRHLSRDTDRLFDSIALVTLSRMRASGVAIILSISVATGMATHAQQPPRGAPADAEFQALVTKTNLYVQALNALQTVQRSYDRYTSWVDVKKGFTGKERYISYGLYELNSSSVNDIRTAAEKGPQMPPPLPELDGVITRVSEAVVALAPLVTRASDYFEQEDYKDDGAKLGQELHAQMVPLFDRTFAGERELRRGLDAVKGDLDRRQLAEAEKISGRKYEWHLRSFMIAAKGVVGLLPPRPESPPIAADVYKERYAELETTYNAFTSYTSEHPEEVKKVLMASFVDTAGKDFFAASKFLRRTLEAPKLDRREYVERLGELAKNYNDLIQRTNSIR